MYEQSQAVSSRRLRVFLCHSSGDKLIVRTIYQRLRACNVDPWLDEENLLPGQDWEREIRKEVRATDIVIVCLSRGSINKTGFVQKEIKFALDVADQQPEDSIFIIPLKLEECELPERLSGFQAVKYFEEKGFEKLMRALQSRALSLKPEVAPIDGKSSMQQVPSSSQNKQSSSFNSPISPYLTTVQIRMPQLRKVFLTRPLVLIVLAILVVIGSGGLFYFTAVNHDSMIQASATATAQARATTTIQPTTLSSTTPTATVSNSYPPKNAHLEVNDPLSSTTPGWGVSDTSCQFMAGAYHIHTAKGLSSCFYSTPYTNFVYEIRMKFVTSDPKADTCGGIIFRYESASQFTPGLDTYYSFLLCTSGACQFAAGGTTIPLGNALYSNAACPGINKNSGQANLIAVVAQGEELSVFVNRMLITHVKNNSSSSGLIGAAVNAPSGEGEVAFNDAKVWTL